MSKAALFGQRGKVYGRNYMVFGDVMAGMFPAGLTLKTKEDFVRLGLFVQIVSKITRYSNAFSTGHADSLDDNSVYSQMLAVVDQDVIKRHIGDRR